METNIIPLIPPRSSQLFYATPQSKTDWKVVVNSVSTELSPNLDISTVMQAYEAQSWDWVEQFGEITMFGRNIRAEQKKELEWYEKLGIADKVNLGIATAILIFGIVDLIDKVPTVFNWAIDLMIIWGGFSLLMTAVLLAKRIGIHKER